MKARIVFRIIMSLLLVAAVVGLVAVAYNSGISQGAAQAARLGAQANPGQPSPMSYPYYPWPVAPFGFHLIVNFIVGFFLIMLIFRLIRGLFWMGPFGWMHMGYHHHGGFGRWGMYGQAGNPEGQPGDVPPMFAEWHRRAHEAGAAKPSEESKNQS
jgi:hypothetical protein